MEGKDMPSGQPCDVFAICRNMRAYVSCRRGRQICEGVFTPGESSPLS